MSNNTFTSLLSRHIDTITGKGTNQTLSLDTNLVVIQSADATDRGNWISQTASRGRLVNGQLLIQIDDNTLFRYVRGGNRGADTWVQIAGASTDRQFGDQHRFATTALRNAATNVVWHQNDIAIITDPDPDQAYIYVGTNQATAGVTVDSDWLFLGLVETQELNQQTVTLTVTDGSSVAAMSTTGTTFTAGSSTVEATVVLPGMGDVSEIRSIYWNGVRLKEGTAAQGGDYSIADRTISFRSPLIFPASGMGVTDNLEIVLITISS